MILAVRLLLQLDQSTGGKTPRFERNLRRLIGSNLFTAHDRPAHSFTASSPLDADGFLHWFSFRDSHSKGESIDSSKSLSERISLVNLLLRYQWCAAKKENK